MPNQVTSADRAAYNIAAPQGMWVGVRTDLTARQVGGRAKVLQARECYVGVANVVGVTWVLRTGERLNA